MSAPLFRAIELMRRLPVAPRRRSTGQLRRALQDLGLPTSLRTVQRTLQVLSLRYPIDCDELHKPYGWAWQRDREPAVFPLLDVPTALALALADEHLQGLLPPGLSEQLAPLVARARALLAGLPRQLERRFRVLGRGPRLKGPTLEAGVVSSVGEALLAGRKLDAFVRPRGGGSAEALRLSPLALVSRAERLYVVVRADGEAAPRAVALHRVERAEPREEPADEAGFDLDAFLEEGGFDRRSGTGSIRLRLRLSREAAPALAETALSDDQVTHESADGSLEVEATVADSHALRSWILGFGPEAEVLGPEELRSTFAVWVGRMALAYGGRSTPRVSGRG